MKVIPIVVEAGISFFEFPAAEYKELGLSLDQLLINHPNVTFIGQAMKMVNATRPKICL
jgi:DNA polymerase V